MRRNEQLTLLDDRFEKVNRLKITMKSLNGARSRSPAGVSLWTDVVVIGPFQCCAFKESLSFQFYEQFDDDEIGALDNTEVEGFIQPDSARLDEIIKDYFIQKEKE